jgi:Fe-S-cluster containining protein
MRREMGKKEFLATRPAKAKEAIQDILRGWDCLECGRCCREDQGKFHIRLLRSESGFMAFRKMATRRPEGTRAKVQEMEDSVLFSFRDSRCMHLGESGMGCLAYDERPLVCRVFPFIFSIQRDVSLSSACPELKTLREQGILFIYRSDFWAPEIPLLKKTEAELHTLMGSFNKAHPEFRVDILVDDGAEEPFYPIR